MAPSSRLGSTSTLGSGEADAISLAQELGIKEVLIDERRGRKIADREGLMPPPTLAVLELAATQNLLALRPTLERLQRTNFRIPQQQIADALDRDTARKRSQSPPTT
jgi:predicted nucleic acid-binding protein